MVSISANLLSIIKLNVSTQHISNWIVRNLSARHTCTHIEVHISVHLTLIIPYVKQEAIQCTKFSNKIPAINRLSVLHCTFSINSLHLQKLYGFLNFGLFCENWKNRPKSMNNLSLIAVTFLFC